MKTKILLSLVAPFVGAELGAQSFYAVNAGGAQYTDSAGVTYEADNYFTGGSTYSTGASIANTGDDALYQSERWGVGVKYDFPVDNGNYLVTIKYAEIYQNASGKRLFRMAFEGDVNLDLIDVYNLAGGKNIAYDETHVVEVTDGVLNLETIQGPRNNPKISAILVEQIPTPTAYAVNAGSAYTDSNGRVYEGNLNSYSNASLFKGGNSSTAISGTTDDALYQGATMNNGSFDLDFPIVDGQYIVTLKFAEIDSFVSGAGERLFNVSLEGNQDPVVYDVAADAGGKFAAYDVAYSSVEVVDGELNLNFQSATGSSYTYPMVSAITIDPMPTSYAINSGGSEYTDASGLVYQADDFYTSGAAYSTGASIAGTDDDVLYQSERWGNFGYELPIADGDYTVTIKFAEIYHNSSSQRLFRIRTEGVTELPLLDIYSLAGGKNIAYDRVYDVTVTDGIMNIDTLNGPQDNPKISAIVVEPKTIPSFYAINVGGGSFVDSNGVTYQADDPSFYAGSNATIGYFNAAPISGTIDDGLYQSQRIASVNNFEYNLPIQNGTYNVTLKTALIADASILGSSTSTYNTRIETPATQIHFISSTVGQDAAYDYTETNVVVTDGVLNIDLFRSSGSGFPHLSAILVELQ